MKSLQFLISIAVALIILATACGGDGEKDEADGTITVIPNLAQRREGLGEQETMELFQAIMQRRAEYYEGAADVAINGDNTLTVTYKDIAADVAEDLFSRSANLTLGGPRRQGDDQIICLRDTVEHYIPFEGIVYEEIGTKFIPACTLEDGRRADIAWEQLETLELGAINNLDIERVTLLTEAGPTLLIGLNQNGQVKLASITQRIVGLPMGIFIDGALVGGPRVSQFIQDGQFPIAGLSLSEARLLRAQLRAGAVPAPFVTRVDE